MNTCDLRHFNCDYRLTLGQLPENFELDIVFIDIQFNFKKFKKQINIYSE